MAHKPDQGQRRCSAESHWQVGFALLGLLCRFVVRLGAAQAAGVEDDAGDTPLAKSVSQRRLGRAADEVGVADFDGVAKIAGQGVEIKD